MDKITYRHARTGRQVNVREGDLMHGLVSDDEAWVLVEPTEPVTPADDSEGAEAKPTEDAQTEDSAEVATEAVAEPEPEVKQPKPTPRKRG